jgi:pyrroloquinoline quinone (PQQ) biosynthesis protein C
MSMQNVEGHLKKNERLQRLLHHPFFSATRKSQFSKDAVAHFLSQYWHPIAYFPTFLARATAVVPTTEVKTWLSRILYQELGEGDPQRAHEVVYLKTMTEAGFSEEALKQAPQTEATRRLMQMYHESTGTAVAALGCIYGTEVIDLTLVRALGEAVRRVSGTERLPWVEIHVNQEPDHVKSATTSVTLSLGDGELSEITANAEMMWQCWSDFFSELNTHTSE